MKRVLKIDPSIGSLNIGDEIISKGIDTQLNYFLKDKFVTTISSHLPLNNSFSNIFSTFDFRLICGSNLLSSQMWNVLNRQFGLGFAKAKKIGPMILVGVGWQKYGSKPDFLTRKFLKRILSKNGLHSVRDEYTKRMLELCGIKNVIITGCPTMWKFDNDFCKLIKTKKANSVVFTLTDYSQDKKNDLKLVKTLIEKYENVYFWPQGSGDMEYFNSFGFSERVNLINANLSAFEELITKTDIDYVGTRLHGGIFALQHMKRSIIISIDNRAKEISKSTNLPILERNEMSDLGKLIDSDIVYDIRMPLEKINEWKNQFNGK